MFSYENIWINRFKAAALLGVGVKSVSDVARAGGIRVRKLPGRPFPRFHREDLERVLRESVGVGAAPGSDPTPAPKTASAPRKRATARASAAAPTPREQRNSTPAPTSRKRAIGR